MIKDECISGCTVESDSSPDDKLAGDIHTHSVVFKCIGAAKERRPQPLRHT